MPATNNSACLSQVVHQMNTVLLGKSQEIKLALTCLFAGGHLLIEDLPGMGKTTLAQGLAKTLGMRYKRIQFTSDLLPGDVLGVSVFSPKTQEFSFRPGPVFTQILLADEINRSSPKTQSALLEAMSEGQVTLDGTTHVLDRHFSVIATQNATHQTGTFPLPESQLDRFMLRISLGYPDPQHERALFQGNNPRHTLEGLEPAIGLEQFESLQAAVNTVLVSDHLLDYFQRLLAYTRESVNFNHGLSPRAALAWLKGAKAWALLNGRHHVLPEDLQMLMQPVAGHRLMPTEPEATARKACAQIIGAVPVVQ